MVTLKTMGKIFVCTELVADLFGETAESEPNRCVLGGAGRFAAAAAAKLLANSKDRAYLLSPISTDLHGQEFRKLLSKAGVDLSLAQTVSNNTMIARVFPNRLTGGNDYKFTVENPADSTITIDSLPTLGKEPENQIDPRGNVFIFGSVSAVLDPAGKALLEYARKARELGGIVIYDLNARAKALPLDAEGAPDWAYFRKIVEKWNEVAHIIKASDEDIGHAYPGETLEDRMAQWVQSSECAVVTLGSAGSKALTKGAVIWGDIPRPIKGVEVTVGAGDNFLAGMAVAVLQQQKVAHLRFIEERAWLLESGRNAATEHLLEINPGSELQPHFSGHRFVERQERPLSP